MLTLDVKNILISDAIYLYFQLLWTISFTQPVKLHSVKIAAPDDGKVSYYSGTLVVLWSSCSKAEQE